MTSPQSNTPLRRFALGTTKAIGSTTSIIAHSIFFVGIFSLHFFGFSISDILLILTTVVSLEAIYLSIFIQMSLNFTAEDLQEVQEDVEEIQRDVDEIQEDVEDIQEDVEDIQEEVEEIGDDMEEQHKDQPSIDRLEQSLRNILKEIEALKKQ